MRPAVGYVAALLWRGGTGERHNELPRLSSRFACWHQLTRAPRPRVHARAMADLVTLNVGGVRYETSRMTLLGGGGASFFSGLLGDTGASMRGPLGVGGAGGAGAGGSGGGAGADGADGEGDGARAPSPPPPSLQPGSYFVAPRRKRAREPGDAGAADDAPPPLFIDRSGPLFGPILEFLRTGSLPAVLQDDRAALADLAKEAQYYLIQPLIDHIAERQRLLGSPLAETWGVLLPSAQGQQGGSVVEVTVPEGREITITRVVRPRARGVGLRARGAGAHGGRCAVGPAALTARAAPRAAGAAAQRLHRGQRLPPVCVPQLPRGRHGPGAPRLRPQPAHCSGNPDVQAPARHATPPDLYRGAQRRRTHQQRRRRRGRGGRRLSSSSGGAAGEYGHSAAWHLPPHQRDARRRHARHWPLRPAHAAARAGRAARLAAVLSGAAGRRERGVHGGEAWLRAHARRDTDGLQATAGSE